MTGIARGVAIGLAYGVAITIGAACWAWDGARYARNKLAEALT